MFRFVVFACAFLAACQSGVVTNSDHDRNVKFAEYKYFTWVSEHPLIIAGERPADLNPLLEKYVMDAVAKNLESKGFALSTDPSKIDFVISYTLGVRDRIKIARSLPVSHSFFRYDYNVAWRHHYGGWGADYYGHTAVRTHIYREGTLAIDFFDGESGHPSWHGWATKTITEADRANVEEVVSEVVNEILSEFPPG